MANQSASRARGGAANDRAGGGMLPQLDPKQLLLSIRERWLSATALALIVCVLVGWYQLSQTKTYRAQARVLMERPDRIVDMAEVSNQVTPAGRDSAEFETMLLQINSRPLAERVVKTLTREQKLRAWRPYNLKSEDNSPSDERLNERLAAICVGLVSAKRQGRTLYINIGAVHRDPESAALLANRFAEQLLIHLIERRSSANDSAISFLSKQVEELGKKAEDAEFALQRYRQKHGMVSLDDKQNIVVERMRALSSTATSAQVARLTIESRLKQAQAIIDKGADPLELAAIANTPNLVAVQSQIDALNSRRNIMAQKYGAKHPQMIENQSSIIALEQSRADLILVAMANLKNQRDQALKHEEELKRQLATAEQESLQLDQLAVEYNRMKREAETNRLIYTQILSRMNETRVTSQLDNTNIRVVDTAFTPRVPFEPNPTKIFSMLGVLALGIIVGYPIGLELLFNRVKSWGDIENYLGVNLLGEFPALQKIDTKERPHLLTRAQDEGAAELVRSFYSQLKLYSKIDPPKTIVVTSTIPGEGKSFVAANLAAAFATHGARTLIIDADLRRPVQHRAFGRPNSHGILRWFEEKHPLPVDPLNEESLGIFESSPNLFVLLAGGTTRRVTEVVETERVRELLGCFQKHFDVVIVDTPPAGVFPDALSIAEYAHELVFVVRFNYVSRPAVRRVMERLRSTGIETPGMILNMMPSGRVNAGYYSGYGYYGSKNYAAYYQQGKKGEGVT